MSTCNQYEAQHLDGAQCSDCHGRFDFACAGISESEYRHLSEDGKSNWKCNSCNVTPRVTEKKAGSTSPSPKDIDNILCGLKTLHTHMASLPVLLENVTTIQAELQELKYIKTDITDVKTSLEFVHGSVKKLSDRITEVDQQVQVLKKSKEEISDLQKRVSKLEQELREGEQRYRMNIVEIEVDKGALSTNRSTAPLKMDEFFGKEYTLVSSENFEEYLSFLGIGYIPRKIATSLKPTQRLTLNEDGTYTFEFLSAVSNSAIRFTPGVEFEEVKPGGSKAQSTITVEGNKLIHIQVEPSGKKSTHIREFFPDKLVVTTTAIGFDKTVKRIYDLTK